MDEILNYGVMMWRYNIFYKDLIEKELENYKNDKKTINASFLIEKYGAFEGQYVFSVELARFVYKMMANGASHNVFQSKVAEDFIKVVDVMLEMDKGVIRPTMMIYNVSQLHTSLKEGA